MTENQKKEIAVFRFGIIGEFVTGAQLNYGEKERLIQDKCLLQKFLQIEQLQRKRAPYTR